jgi:hypothetical protein
MGLTDGTICSHSGLNHIEKLHQTDLSRQVRLPSFVFKYDRIANFFSFISFHSSLAYREPETAEDCRGDKRQRYES